MNKAIILDLDETLLHGIDDNKIGSAKMVLRPELDILLDKLKEVKNRKIDIILCTTARNKWVKEFLLKKSDFKEVFVKLYTRDNEGVWKEFSKEKYPLEYEARNKNINLEYAKPITTFGYDSILFLEDNKIEYARLEILFQLTEGKLEKDVTFYNVEKFFGDVTKEDFECKNMVKIIDFFEKKKFQKGLTYIDKNNLD